MQTKQTAAPYYSITQIYPWLYSLRDPLDVYCYLVRGERGALLYDTCHGAGPLAAEVRTLAEDLDVIVSHGHFDHSGGSGQFPKIWLHSADTQVFMRHTSRTARKMTVDRLEPHLMPSGFDADAFCAAKGHAGLSIEPAEDAAAFNLGDISAQVVHMPGHTAGSIGLYIPQKKTLLVSDATNAHVWMFLPESLTIAEYIAMLQKTLRIDFDTFFVGHQNNPLPKSEMETYMRLAQSIDREKSTPYPQLPEYNGFKYTEGGASIIYSLDKL